MLDFNGLCSLSFPYITCHLWLMATTVDCKTSSHWLANFNFLKSYRNSSQHRCSPPVSCASGGGPWRSGTRGILLLPAATAPGAVSTCPYCTGTVLSMHRQHAARASETRSRHGSCSPCFAPCTALYPCLYGVWCTVV